MGESLKRRAVRAGFCRFERFSAWLGCGLAIHHGRHTFVSHALAGGRSLAEVWAAAHSNLAVTSVSLHVLAARGCLCRERDDGIDSPDRWFPYAFN